MVSKENFTIEIFAGMIYIACVVIENAWRFV